MYQAVLFDMDGVVVDTQDSVRSFWQQLARDNGYSLRFDDLEQHVYGHRADHTLRILFPQIPATQHPEIYRRLRHDQENRTYWAIPGVQRLLKELREAGIPLALVTGAQDWKMVEVLDQLGLSGTFDVRICADDVPTGKPDPACYLHAAKRLDVDITKCVVFEDAISGVTAAATAGADCVAIVPQHRASQALAAGAITFARDFENVGFRRQDFTLHISEKAKLAFRDKQELRTLGGTGMDDLFTPPADLWEASVAGHLSGVDEVIYRSHAVGADPALAKEGGGSFSAKGRAVDRQGRLTRVLWMSAWGCDGATTTAEDFPALRLDDLLALRAADPPGGVPMMDYLADCALEGEQRCPGIETLLHAFVTAGHVDHSHPDAVIALTAFPCGREIAEATFGDEAIWFDYRQFDLDVARELADRIAASPRARFLLLANHGLLTWAQTSKECYRNSLEAVARAAKAVTGALLGPADLGGPAVAPVPPDRARQLLFRILPAIRGALSEGNPGVVTHLDQSAEAVRFASSARGPRWSQAGPSCPDHVVTTGYRPLVLDGIPSEPGQVLEAISAHRRWYDRFFEQHVPAAGRVLGKRDNAPRVIVLPGIGVLSSGPDAAKARLCADHFAQTMTVIRAADAAGGYQTLSQEQGAADEYWPLMRQKPQLRPPDGMLAGKVFLVAGTDEARVSGTAGRLAGEGAHVALAGKTRQSAAAAAEEITERYGERRATPVCPVRDPKGAVRDAVIAYGGFDALVDLTGDGRLVKPALSVFTGQGNRGAVLLTHTTENESEHEDERTVPDAARDDTARGDTA